LVLHAFRLLHDLGLAAPIAFHPHMVELGFLTPRKRRCFPLAPRNVLSLSDVGTRQFKSRSVVQCHRQSWAFLFTRIYGDLTPTPAPVPSTILRVSSLMMMGRARLQSGEAKRSAISIMAFSIRQAAEAMCISRILRTGPLPSAAVAGIQACAYAPKSAPSPHYRQPRPRGANVYLFDNHTPCGLGRCGDHPSLVLPPRCSWSEPEPSPYF
jgi:hypothetical protein